MISILIPIYNFNASNLLQELFEQSKLIKDKVEIIIYDDHSNVFENVNRITAKKLNFDYSYLANNIGRSKIRNMMANKATSDYLLFLDGDILPKSKKFIQNYLDEIESDTEVIYGGRIHVPDERHQNKLRWKYGYFKEDKTPEQRQKKPYLSLVSNNLLIRKTLFKSIYFEESLTTYGHEDTLLAIQLKARKCNCVHIYNPVIHQDIDENDVFIDKTESALKNLMAIHKTHQLQMNEIKILKVYKSIERFKLKSIAFNLFRLLEKPLKFHLIKNKSNLFLLDVYKLGYFIKISRS
ncbi:glycosyltransferase [Psychroflexus sediminis]|uniref:Glycosyl transferase family 2 n=1 Tax=Psychroflexus sediminis TaxID=470826 RepID=A0A1G7VD39_9FLAO|nr:glycosyltransferase family 2 protein [Psychroflexus sediminis]SDG57653.1 Glycosyl transferase family 2 [Psychroflexus sediminis]